MTKFYTIHVYDASKGRILVYNGHDGDVAIEQVKSMKGEAHFLFSSYETSNGGLDIRREQYYKGGDNIVGRIDRSRVNLTREDLEFLAEEGICIELSPQLKI